MPWEPKDAPEHTKTLSQRRAEAVVRYLVQKGVAKDRLDALGHGADKPVGDNATEEGRAQNRRVQLTVTSWSALEAKPQSSDDSKQDAKSE